MIQFCSCMITLIGALCDCILYMVIAQLSSQVVIVLTVTSFNKLNIMLM